MKAVAWVEPQPQVCPDCGGDRLMISGEVLENDITTAAFLAFLYDHDGYREVYLDLILGPWGDDADPAERLTFSARTGPGEGGGIGTTLLDGGATAPDDALLGTRVSREAGLEHPLLPKVWQVNDAVLGLPAVASHLQHPHDTRRRRRWWPLGRA